MRLVFLCNKTPGAPFYYYGLTLIPAWINNCVHYILWSEITYPFPNSIGATVEVWEWISSFIPYFIVDVITFPCFDKSKIMLVKRTLGSIPFQILCNYQHRLKGKCWYLIRKGVSFTNTVGKRSSSTAHLVILFGCLFIPKQWPVWPSKILSNWEIGSVGELGQL